MKRIAIFLAGAALVSLLSLSSRAADAPTTRPSADERNRALEARIAQLEKEVAQLKDEVKQKETVIQRQQRAFTLTPQLVPIPRITPPALPPNSNLRFYSAPEAPRGAVPQQFNGSAFYLVPLADNEVTVKTEGSLPQRVVEFQGIVIDPAPTMMAQPTGGTLLDDRSGPTRELIHGK